jgi:P4 family phage/plasmid primase-like protien
VLTLQDLLIYFKVSKKLNDTSYQCVCPTHHDGKASLTISESNGKLLLYCHAGCDTKDILGAVGLSYSDIGNYTPPQWRERLEFYKQKKIEAVYDYCDEKGRYQYSKIRFEGKEIIYATVDKKGDSYKLGRTGKRTVLYNLHSLIKAVREGYPVYIVEGEKDADTLRKLGYSVTTPGGASDWKKEYASYFIGAKVIILPDNDEPGLQLKDQIMRDLRNYAHSVSWTTTSKVEKGDVYDYLVKENHPKEDLHSLISSAETIMAPWIFMEGSGDKARAKINGDILADCISKTMYYMIVRRPEEEKDDFYIYDHGVYSRCNRNTVRSYIRRYIPVGLASDSLINNIYNLLTCKEGHICGYRDLDADEWYINLKNGMYNVKTKQIEPHTPDKLTTIQLNCEYHPENHNMPNFNHYINDLCSDIDGKIDDQKKAILQEFMGLILSNVRVSRIKKCLVLYSLLGNSGKTQLLNLIGELLGTENTINVPLQQMNENSKFSLGSIVGKRLISIGDQTGSDVEDSAVFKQLTGGDPVKVEPKNKQPFSYIFNGAIAISCNNLVNFQDDKGGHVFERLCIIPCTNTIPPEKRDGELLDKMLLERDVIFNWFLEGLHRLISNKYQLTNSTECDNVINDYRDKLDTIYRFIHENYSITSNKMDMVSKTDFEQEYIDWCKSNDYTAINKRSIKERMEKNGVPLSKDAKGNWNYRNIVKGTGEFMSTAGMNQEEMPFL